MRKFVLAVCSLFLCLGGMAMSAKATNVPLTLNGGFVTYDEFIGGVGHFFGETWTYTGPAELTVTDLFVVGDAFHVFDNGSLILSTPIVPDWSTIPGCDGNPLDASCGYQPDPNVAVTDPNFSSGEVTLGGGSHNITIEEIEEPSTFADSSVALELTTAEPSSLLLLGTGLLGLGVMAFWRKQSARSVAI